MSWSNKHFFDNIFTTFFAGFRPFDNTLVNLILISTFMILFLLFFIPVFIPFNHLQNIIFASAISLAIAIFKISIYVICTLRKKRNSQEETKKTSTITEPLLKTDVFQYDYHEEKDFSFLNNFEFLFANPPSLLHVIISIILAFTSTFFALSLSNHVSFLQRSLNCVVAGTSIYSMLQTPIVDPYSTTVNDLSNGLTRPFYVTIIGGFGWVFASISGDVYIPIFNIELNFNKYAEKIAQVSSWFLILTPILILCGMIGHPRTTLLYFIEIFNMYFFGQSGVGGLIDAIISFLRGFLSVGLICLVLLKKTELRTLSISLSIAYGILQLPIPISSSHLRNHVVFIFFSILIPPFAIFAILTIFKITHHTLCAIACFGSIFFDWILPQIYSNQRYFPFHFRLTNFIQYTDFLRLLTPLFFAPLYCLGIIHSMSPDYPPFWISAFFITSTIQLSLCEPHLFSLSISISFGIIEYDLGYEGNYLRNAFIGLWFSRKFHSVYKYLEFLSISRKYPFIQGCENTMTSIIVFILNHLPMPDAAIKIPSFLFSATFGCPLATPMMLYYIVMPSAPRPILFWDSDSSSPLNIFSFDFKFKFIFNFRFKHESNSIENALNSQLGEHPVEAPVYASASRSLSTILRKVIRTGRLGRVTAGDIFFFSCDNMGAFVHIISNSPLSTKFQLRGLEFSSQTPCHRNERFSLVNAIEDYSNFPNICHAFQSLVTSFEIRYLGLPIMMHDVVVIEANEAFIGCSQKNARFLMYSSLCYNIAQTTLSIRDIYAALCVDTSLDPQSIISNTKLEYKGVLSTMLGREQNPNALEEDYNDDKIVLEFFQKYISKVVFGDTTHEHNNPGIIKMTLDPEGLCVLFNNEKKKKRFASNTKTNSKYDDGCYKKLPKKIQNLITDSSRIGMLLISLASADLLGDAYLTNFIELKKMIENCEEDYICGSVSDKKFSLAFEEGTKTLISIARRRGNPVFIKFTPQLTKWDVFSIKRECVLAFWANEARSQLFFGEDSPERDNVQTNAITLSNMILQSCNLPIGYPGFISPILDSYDFPVKTTKRKNNQNQFNDFLFNNPTISNQNHDNHYRRYY